MRSSIRVQGVIFDWAGTTVDYGCLAPAMVFVAGFAARGVTISLDEARLPMGKYKRDHIAELLAMPAIAERWLAAQGHPPGEADIDALFADFIPRQEAALLDYAEVIPGAVETAAALRARGIRIGSTTGYTQSMMALLTPRAAEQGYAPDCLITPDMTAGGRPAPWMCYLNAIQLGIYPMMTLVKVGDTMADIAEGLNAGMWTVAVTRTGNELGLSRANAEALPASALQRRLEAIEQRFRAAGAHYIIESIADLLPVIDDIDSRLTQGEHPVTFSF
jgi:phosphonoacetaldehyde hydrolase